MIWLPMTEVELLHGRPRSKASTIEQCVQQSVETVGEGGRARGMGAGSIVQCQDVDYFASHFIHQDLV